MVSAAQKLEPVSSTRDRLIEAAFRVVARDGLETASVKTIAAEADITPGLVHYHFTSKEAVIEAALRHGLEDYLARCNARRAAMPPHRQIETFFLAMRDIDEADREFFKVRLALASRAMTHAGLAETMAEINTAIVAELAMVFATAVSNDAVPTDRDLALAATVQAALDGIMLMRMNNPSYPIEAAGEILESAVSTWMEQPRLL
jgi:AcrR family transcriptional regulator